MIPASDPKSRFDLARDDIRLAIERVFDRGQFICGPETEAFEDEFAAYLGARHVVGVSCGTDAIELALVAAGLRPGDEVITVSLTAVATAIAIEEAAGVPRFVDVNPATRCMDPDGLASAIGPRTVAIVPVHLHGIPAPMDEILAIAERHALLVVEDCAQAHGATHRGRRVGTFGHAAAFSFYPTKNLGAAGDGGAVATSDARIAARIRRMRSYGWDDRRVSAGPGANRRLDELQAAILRVLLPRLEAANAERRQLAAQYRCGLAELPIEMPPDDEGAVYHQFAVAVDRRDALQAVLARRGIQTGIHYPFGVHQQPRFASGTSELPHTERLVKRLLSLPIQPEIARNHLPRIVQAIGEARA